MRPRRKSPKKANGASDVQTRLRSSSIGRSLRPCSEQFSPAKAAGCEIYAIFIVNCFRLYDAVRTLSNNMPAGRIKRPSLHQLLQSRVLFLQLLPLAHLIHFQTDMLLRPTPKRLFTDPRLTDQTVAKQFREARRLA